ncbi:tetratricopeptide repeat protein [Flavobacterium humi]|uniref:Tetratricopeptide repeat protein n=1 Tax=Flavobacterium humi TaxID=2562683 RepID=A0A4Z0LAK7_9FLAO|nr:hypothetical protein [Flavobacterium humi]TGD58098.1 hypothetical protein E4635_08810 [Flavobacterium humi]
MTKIFTMIALFVCSLLSAQTLYEKGMGNALTVWKSGKSAEASALFERIATVEKNNWLPNYYVAFINTVEAFKAEDKAKIPAYLDKAQKALDEAAIISPNNAEIMVVQAMIYTGWIVQDPMTNGMKYSNKAMEQYYKAQVIAPNNPRVVSCKAEFEIGGAQWTGADVKSLCKDMERAIKLYADFKPESPFHPTWGLERAQENLKSCSK